MSHYAQTEAWWPASYPIQQRPDKNEEVKEIPPEKQEEPLELPTSIPAVQDSHKHAPGARTIVVCLDGTGDKFDGDNSNVVDFVTCLKKDDPYQVTYYQSGIGTYDSKGLSSGISAAMDMAVGSSLGVHVKDAYRFLMQTYREGDRICLFGFSRGAYTVRCLAGMLHKVGLLPPHNKTQVQFAYQIYKDNTEEGWQMSNDFKKTFCMNVNVYFVGVWDCVASVGFIPRTLPLSSTRTSWIQHFRHAISLDERRAKFKVCRWQQDSLDNCDDEESGYVHKLHQLKKKTRRKRKIEEHHVPNDVLEVWFAGCHADVGGGAVVNEERHKLSRIPLRWMIRQCFECNTGIIFDTTALAETGLDVHKVWPVYIKPTVPSLGPSPDMLEKYFADKLPPIHRRSSALGLGTREQIDQLEAETLIPEQYEDYFDSRAPINDQLKLAKGWWMLEFWPIGLRREVKPGIWQKYVGWNLGQHRVVRDADPKLHWTVERRMIEMGYKIRNKMASYATWEICA
uniref:ARAD1D50578p n=1 Tax=Blastobotrys adeninivorans TaxID=409370 RepID=A0A060TIY0_BLAAD